MIITVLFTGNDFTELFFNTYLCMSGRCYETFPLIVAVSAIIALQLTWNRVLPKYEVWLLMKNTAYAALKLIPQ
jgi:hypothetical protein